LHIDRCADVEEVAGRMKRPAVVGVIIGDYIVYM
jgi:hypothetical protein